MIMWLLSGGAVSALLGGVTLLGIAGIRRLAGAAVVTWPVSDPDREEMSKS